jgi:hypothetical protein
MTKKARNEQTSAEVASEAAKILRDPNASPEEKRVAASALTQAESEKARDQSKDQGQRPKK